MPPTLPANLLRGLSVYQDVVLGGITVNKGRRDCGARWQLIAPHLTGRGAVLDVGSNFGWFGLKICQTFPNCVVASLEADLRSAAVQRAVLESHAHNRICLLVRRADSRLAQAFLAAGQRFEA